MSATKQKKYGDGAKWVSKQITQVKNVNPQLEKDFYQKAQQYLIQQNYNEAAKEFQELKQMRPLNYIYLYELANLQQFVGTKEFEMIYLQKCIMLHNTHPEAFFKIGLLLEGKGQMKEAVEYYNKQIVANKQHIESYIKISEFFISQSSVKKAINILQICLEHNQTSEKIMILLKNMYLENSKVEEAASIDKIISVQINKILEDKSINNFFETKQLVKQITILVKIIKQNPQSATLKYKIAFYYYQFWHPFPTLTLLKQAIQQVPQLFYIRSFMGKIYLKINSLEEAKQQFLEVLKYHPLHSSALCEIGKIELKNKNYKLALKYLKKSISIFGNCTTIYCSLGITYWKLKKIDKAYQHLFVSKTINEASPYGTYILGKCYLIKGDVIKAKEVLNSISKKDLPQKEEKIMCYLAIANYKQGKYFWNPLHNQMMKQINSPLGLKVLKQNIILLLNSQNSQEILKASIKLKPFLEQFKILDFYALLCEAILVSGCHLFLAIEIMEQALGFNRFDKKQINEEFILKEPNEEDNKKIGCYIQEAKVLMLLGEDKKALRQIHSIIVYLDTLKVIKQKDTNLTAIKSAEHKKIDKEEIFEIDWSPKADLLYAEIQIKIENFESANQILDSFQKRNDARFLNQVNNLQGKLHKNQGEIQKAKEIFGRNIESTESAFELGLALQSEGQVKEASEKFKIALLHDPTNLMYLKESADLEFEIKGLSSSRLYEVYLEEIFSQNKWLSLNTSKNRQIQVDEKVFYNFGVLRLNEKKYQSSLKYLRQSLQLNPHSRDTLLMVAVVNRKIKNNKEAEKILRELIKEKEEAEVYYQLGIIQLEIKDIGQTKEYLQKAVTIDPYHFLALRTLGNIFINEQEYEISRQYLDRAQLILPSDEFTYLYHCECVWKIERNASKVEQQYLSYLELHKESDLAFQLIIDFYRKIQKLPGQSFLNARQNLLNQNPISYFYLGDLFFHCCKNTSDYNKSEEYLQKWIEEPQLKRIENHQSQTFLILAQIYFYFQKLSKVTQYLSKYPTFATSDSKNSKPSFYDLNPQKEKYDYLILQARMAMIQSIPNSPKFMKKCIQIDPSNYLSYSQMAFFLLSRGSNQAWEFLQKAHHCLENVSFQNLPEQVLILDALHSADQKNYGKAREILKIVLQKSKESQAAFFYMGEIFMKENEFKEAIKMYNQINFFDNKQLNFSHSAVLSQDQKFHALVQLATALHSTNLESMALLTVEKCLEKQPKNAKALMIRSQILMKSGNIKKALQSAQDSALQDPEASMTHYLLALLHLRSGNVLQSISSLLKCQTINPDFPNISLKLALVYQRISRPKIAINFIIQHLTYHPKSKYALLQSAKLFAYFGKFKQSHSNLSRLFEILSNPQNDDIKPLNDTSNSFHFVSLHESQLLIDEDSVDISSFYSVQAFLFSQEENFEAAIISLKKVLEMKVDDEDTFYSIAQAYSQLKKPKESIHYYSLLIKQTMKDNPKYEAYLVNLGNELKSLNYFNEAINYYQMALKSSHKSAINILVNIASTYIEKLEYEKAIRALEQSMSIDFHHFESLFLLGIANQAQGNLEEAEIFFEGAIKSNPNFSSAWISLAKLKLMTDNIQKSIIICQRCIQQSPQNIEVQIFYGSCLIKTCDYQIALLLYKSILQKNQKLKQRFRQVSVEVICNIQISRIFTLLGEQNQSKKQLQTCLENSPNNPDYLHELACFEAQQEGNLEEALKLFENAIKICPTNPQFKYNMSCFLSTLNKSQLEIVSLKNCLSLKSPLKYKLLNNLGVAYYDSYDTLNSINHLEKALCSSPHAAEVHYNLGNVFFQKAQYQEAIQAYKMSLEINPQFVNALQNLYAASIKQKDYQTAIDSLQQCININDCLKDSFYQKILILNKLGFYPNCSKI